MVRFSCAASWPCLPTQCRGSRQTHVGALACGPCSGALPGELEDFGRLPELVRRPPAADQDPQRNSKPAQGSLVNRVMKRPNYVAPIVIIMILLIIPVGKLILGGISEYLPPTNSVRQAQEEFDKLFPDTHQSADTGDQTSNHQPVTDAQIAEHPQQGDGDRRIHRAGQRSGE